MLREWKCEIRSDIIRKSDSPVNGCRKKRHAPPVGRAILRHGSNVFSEGAEILSDTTPPKTARTTLLARRRIAAEKWVMRDDDPPAKNATRHPLGEPSSGMAQIFSRKARKYFQTPPRPKPLEPRYSPDAASRLKNGSCETMTPQKTPRGTRWESHPPAWLKYSPRRRGNTFRHHPSQNRPNHATHQTPHRG
jgi:hypothetical protein